MRKKKRNFIIKLIILILVIITAILITGFFLFFCTKGSGNIITEERMIPAFSKIDLQSNGNIFITQAKETKVLVETDDNLLPLIKTEVIGDTLIIDEFEEYTGRFSPSQPVNFYITTPDIYNISIKGSGNTIGRSKIKSDKLELRIAGTGDIDLEVEVDELRTEIKGSGDARLKGQAITHDFTVGGSGNLEALDLITEQSKIDINGKTDAKIYVTENLDVNIKGSGDVTYKGTPKSVKQQIKGSGTLEQIPEKIQTPVSIIVLPGQESDQTTETAENTNSKEIDLPQSTPQTAGTENNENSNDQSNQTPTAIFVK